MYIAVCMGWYLTKVLLRYISGWTNGKMKDSQRMRQSTPVDQYSSRRASVIYEDKYKDGLQTTNRRNSAFVGEGKPMKKGVNRHMSEGSAESSDSGFDGRSEDSPRYGPHFRRSVSAIESARNIQFIDEDSPKSDRIQISITRSASDEESNNEAMERQKQMRKSGSPRGILKNNRFSQAFDTLQNGFERRLTLRSESSGTDTDYFWEGEDFKLMNQSPARAILNSEYEAISQYVTHGGSIYTDEDRVKDNRMRVAFLKETKNPAMLMKRGKYEEASTALEEIRYWEEGDEMETLLMITECDIYLGHEEAAENIEKLHAMFLLNQVMSPNDLKVWADKLKRHHRNVGAILLYRAAGYKYETVAANDANGLITWLQWRVVDISHRGASMVKAGGRWTTIFQEYVLGYMLEMLDKVTDIPDSGPKTRALMRAGCLNSIVYVCNPALEFQKSIQYARSGIEILEKQFGSNAQRHSDYGYLLHNLAAAYSNSSRYAEAEPWYVRALKARHKATDYPDEKTKQDDIELTKKNLIHTRKQILNATHL